MGPAQGTSVYSGKRNISPTKKKIVKTKINLHLDDTQKLNLFNILGAQSCFGFLSLISEIMYYT